MNIELLILCHDFTINTERSVFIIVLMAEHHFSENE